jgi:hypothetical protein
MPNCSQVKIPVRTSTQIFPETVSDSLWRNYWVMQANSFMLEEREIKSKKGRFRDKEGISVSMPRAALHVIDFTIGHQIAITYVVRE